MNCKRILIADDHFAIRMGVKQILSQEFGKIEFGEAVSSAEAFKKVNADTWDLLILDINMPDKNGLELLKELKDAHVEVPVLIFSMYREDQVAVRALKAGAAGYLSKDAEDLELVKAVRQLCQGRKYISLSVADLLASQFDSTDRPAHDKLSDREYQTLLMLASGKTVSDIARCLSLSIPTISTYRARILEKMGFRNNAELTRYVIENDLN
jgi:two-component system, NarL family, invasion response regulator UvrY